MPLLPLQPRRHHLDPVERWIASMQASPDLDDGAVGVRVVQLELFCQVHDTAPGDLLLCWERFAADLDGATTDFLRQNGIDVPGIDVPGVRT